MTTELAASTPPFDVTQGLLLMLVASLVAMAGQRLRLPYALALVVTGLGIGLLGLLPQVRLDPHVLFTLLLPPLLFEGALNLRVEHLRADWRPIALLATVGTATSTAVIGSLAHFVLGLPLGIALVFGALISPTDPISVISVLRSLGASKRLSLLVEAESLFNDGVAVVLFTVLLAAAVGGSVSVVDGVRQFLVVVAGGLGVGLAAGAVASRVTRAFDDHLLEITLTSVVAYGAYIGAEALHVSGVVAVVSAGLVVGSYGMRTGMSPATRLAVHSFWEYAAFAANSIVFLLVGLEAVAIRWWERPGLVAAGVAIALTGRAAAVYGLGPLIARHDVPLAWRHLMVWGGLRGALSMALALGLPPDLPFRAEVVALTFGYVLFSLLVQGTTVGRLVSRLGLLEAPNERSRYVQLAVELLARHAGLAELAAGVARGAVPPPAAEPVMAAYRARVATLEAAIAELHMSDAELHEAQLEQARHLAAAAGRAAVLGAGRDGLFDIAVCDEVASSLGAEADEVAVVIQAERTEPA